MDETYVKVKGEWMYLYRAVDKDGQTMDFLLRTHRDKKAALAFFKKAMVAHGEPEKVNLDKSGSNKAAMDGINNGREKPIVVRQVKYLNNIVEQDHRAIKRITRPMMGFKSFVAAKAVLAGNELIHLIRKGQLMMKGDHPMSAAEQFYALAGHVHPA